MNATAIVLVVFLIIGISTFVGYLVGRALKALGSDTSFCPKCNDGDAACPACRNEEGL